MGARNEGPGKKRLCHRGSRGAAEIAERGRKLGDEEFKSFRVQECKSARVSEAAAAGENQEHSEIESL